jgi:hypothetical protein
MFLLMHTHTHCSCTRARETFFFFFCGTGVWIQNFMLQSKGSTAWAMPPANFSPVILEMGVLLTICLGWSWTTIVLISDLGCLSQDFPHVYFKIDLMRISWGEMAFENHMFCTLDKLSQWSEGGAESLFAVTQMILGHSQA